MATENFVSKGKDAISLLKDGILIILILLILLFPEGAKNYLMRSGIKEADFMGIKWKPESVDSVFNTLDEARATITDLKTRLDSTTRILLVTEAEAIVNNPSLGDKIDKMRAENESVISNTTKTQNLIKTTISANAPMVKTAQVAVNGDNEWGVVYGGDATLEAAKYEANDMAKKYGIPNVRIYLRAGSYRSVAVTNSREDAEDVLKNARRRRQDAYIVSMTSWCSNSVDRAGYVECGK